jgi:hypothetical protein
VVSDYSCRLKVSNNMSAFLILKEKYALYLKQV